jgi:hypothetical protein
MNPGFRCCAHWLDACCVARLLWFLSWVLSLHWTLHNPSNCAADHPPPDMRSGTISRHRAYPAMASCSFLFQGGRAEEYLACFNATGC